MWKTIRSAGRSSAHVPVRAPLDKDMMKKSYPEARYALVLFLAIFLLSGCTLMHWFLGEEEEKSPQELMRDGVGNLESGRYKAAVEAFQKIKDRYPYSKYAVLAELKMADALYLTKEWDQALEGYREFEKLHPKHKEIPYVIYQEGMCFFRQMRSIDREQTHTLKAKQEFERLIRKFPRDEYANRARRNLRKCYIFLAEYELYVGNFYYKKGKYRAALGRYLYLLKHYPDMGQYSRALEKISKCKEKIAKEEAKKKG
ncbi:MAG: outer membrane protein assembly factor BamD [Deltaproteobacteria bacterium]|nr:outer membrane protein assembly factor BamD [Deltaproteobacteria bacterium]MBW1978133.1 outer membrane protein assembly factor BamD [Deltaproteobacteria bacterium]MBW2046095.1 outer membrane protein assembly factor BamD [Deltaproteobacteria bacterium]MBW2301016.1 outer membrane protein assembly factor BamD [Deltaproteobacteria bacterium]RLB32982.1 MAG: outer membrane protein assembly factor BamD [Deltaproteobacteria bacterium]